MPLLRIASTISGLLVLWAVLLDALETVVLPRRVRGPFRLTAWYYRLAWGPWAELTKRIRSQGRRESLLAYSFTRGGAESYRRTGTPRARR